MRYLYAGFKGYIGFYNGLGLNHIEIDFSKCKNNIVLISGINGCGKSTLLNALNLFPDPSSSFTPNIDAEKRLTLVDKDNIYQILISSPSDLKGGRKTTKAFISKNGLELNTNGNISSYKEIIFSEFELDSNFISLSKLSSDDRGLGDKTPAERKRFVSNIIENLEVYNEIYKTLNKKSLIFKSNVNNLHTKIQNIGSKENLENQLINLRRTESEYNARLLELNNKIVSIETKISIDQEDLSKIKDINDQMEIVKSNLQSLRNQLNLFRHKTQIKEEDIESKLFEDVKLLESYSSTLESIKVEWTEKSTRMVSVNESIQNIKAQLESYSSNLDTTLESKYRDSCNNINEYDKELFALGILKDFNCEKEEQGKIKIVDFNRNLC